MNHTLIRESSNRFRFGVEETPGKFVDLLCTPDVLKGLEGRGMVHTGVKDRKYFRSIYFKEPGRILFEIATACPGFTIDEEHGVLGQHLQLPSRLEEKRGHLNESLPLFEYNPQKFAQ